MPYRNLFCFFFILFLLTGCSVTPSSLESKPETAPENLSSITVSNIFEVKNLDSRLILLDHKETLAADGLYYISWGIEYADSADSHTENHTVQTEDHPIQTEKPSIQVEDSSIQTKEPSIQVEDSSIQTEEPSIQVEDSSIQTEEPSIQVEDSSIQTEEPSIQYDAQLYLLLGNAKNSENAKQNMDSWLAAGKENYEILMEKEISCNEQSYSVILYNRNSTESAYTKGISAFSTVDHIAVCVELIGTEHFPDDLETILIDFLKNCSYYID